MSEDWLCLAQGNKGELQEKAKSKSSVTDKAAQCVPISRKAFTVKECRICKRDLSFLPAPPKITSPGSSRSSSRSSSFSGPSSPPSATAILPGLDAQPSQVLTQIPLKMEKTRSGSRGGRTRRRLLGSISEAPETEEMRNSGESSEGSDASSSSTPSAGTAPLPRVF